MNLLNVLGGLWHGANWTFVLWGAWHGIILSVERAFGAKKKSPYPRLFAIPITLFFVIIGWVLFRATDVSNALAMYQGMFGFNGFSVPDTIAWSINNLQIFTLIAAYIIVFTAPIYVHRVHRFPHKEGTWAAHLSVTFQMVICTLFFIAFCKLIAQSFSPFLYFQF